MPKLMWIADVDNYPGYVNTHVSVEDNGTRRVAYTRHPTEDRPLTPEEYLAQPGHEHLTLISSEQLDTLRAAHEWQTYLCHPPQEITQERFWEMLEVLPPMNWAGWGEYFERFDLIERQTGNITSQYARLGHGEAARYFTKYVDLTKPETHMTAAGLAQL